MGAHDYSQDLSVLSFDAQLEREWLTTNGRGGFAASTVPGVNTRKYHGLLVAAMAPPVRQMVLLSRVEDFVHRDNRTYPLASSEYPGVIHPRGHELLRAFNPIPFPRWAYQANGWTIEKQLRLLPGENTVCLSYTLLAADKSVDIELKPLFALRGIHDLMYQWNGRLLVESNGKGQAYCHHRVPPTSRTPEVFFAHDGRFQPTPYWYLNTIYRREQERGYPGLEDVWMPGSVRWTLSPGQTVHFVCSTDPIDLNRVISFADHDEETIAVSPPARQSVDTALGALVRAADQFVVEGNAHARETVTRVMAGYPWLPPGGRDSLISLPGLLLVTGKLAQAKSLLEFYATHADRGLMPSEFPWDGSAPRYQSADASLWFINAAWQYLQYGGEAEFVLRQLLPTIESILKHNREGTALGVRVDGEGLLVSREPGTPTSWMDAKAGDWVLTPRYGRPVELNALWYNAQRIAASLARAAGNELLGQQLLVGAEATRDAFNQRFWNAESGCCFDVVDDPSVDAAIRPNQLLAISLPFAVLSIDRQQSVIDVVRDHLLTPFGLRTLSPQHAHYTGRYSGGIVARDRAYHQGTVFPWLLGPYVTALAKVRGRGQSVRDEAAGLIKGCIDYITNEGLGQLCELFDGDAPHHPGGVRASARSIAEILRCYAEEVLDLPLPGAAFADPTPSGLPTTILPVRLGK